MSTNPAPRARASPRLAQNGPVDLRRVAVEGERRDDVAHDAFDVRLLHRGHAVRAGPRPNRVREDRQTAFLAPELGGDLDGAPALRIEQASARTDDLHHEAVVADHDVLATGEPRHAPSSSG